MSDNRNSSIEDNSTRHTILLAGIRLFSTYGYNATTTRMIAEEAKVHLSQISFYYRSKENLYRECLIFISELADQFYGDVCREAEELLLRGNVTREEAKTAVCRLIDRQIVAASERKYRSSLRLIYWEQINTPSDYHPVSDTVFRRVEKVIAELFVAAAGMDYKNAVVASRFLNGAVIAFGEHSLLVGFAMQDADDRNDPYSESSKWVFDDITKYCYKFIDEVLALP